MANTEIVTVRPKIVLDDAQREQYFQIILPFSVAARSVYSHPAIEKMRLLDKSHDLIEEQIAADSETSPEENPLANNLNSIKSEKNKLKNSYEYKTAKEIFRKHANELISAVNTQKATFALANNLINRGAITFISSVQIAPPEEKNKFTKPGSPVLPHNELGVLPIHRDRNLPTDLTNAIVIHSRDLQKTDLGTPEELSLSLAYLVPTHLISNRHAPTYIRNHHDLGRQIVNLSKLVIDYHTGQLKPPTSKEIGLPSKEQNGHIATYLRSLLAHFLRAEITNPNQTEKQLRDSYQHFSDYVREVTRHITPQHGIVINSQDRVGNLMEDLPGIEGPMSTARLSTNLLKDLGLPCIDYTDEVRIAEVLRDITAQTRPNKHNDEVINIKGNPRLLLTKIIESIYDRLETDEIDCQRMFETLESHENGELIITNLFRIVDSEQHDILLQALAQSNCFENVIRKIRYTND